jgi:Tfp pilus assembly protein PilN
LGGRGRRISEFETNLVYRVSSRTARATQRNPVLKRKNKNKKQQQKKTQQQKKKKERKKKRKKEIEVSVLLNKYECF